MDDPPPKACEVCGAKPVERVFRPVPVFFKGSGFYSTDYGRRKRKVESSGGDGGKAEGDTSKAGRKAGREEREDRRHVTGGLSREGLVAGHAARLVRARPRGRRLRRRPPVNIAIMARFSSFGTSTALPSTYSRLAAEPAVQRCPRSERNRTQPSCMKLRRRRGRSRAASQVAADEGQVQEGADAGELVRRSPGPPAAAAPRG